MSHRNRSICCCDDPDTLGTCFTGFGAVPKTTFDPNTTCSSEAPPVIEFNRFDNWDLCSHDNEEELLVKIDRSPWSAETVATGYPSEVCHF